MATLMMKIDDTKQHLVTAVREELSSWQGYVETRRVTLTRELKTLASPAGIQLAALKAADEALARAHAEVHARKEALEAAMRKARRGQSAKPAARRGSKVEGQRPKKPIVFAAAHAA